MDNLLIQSDNILALNYLLRNKELKGKIDLVYIDPPFSTGIDFRIAQERTATISRISGGDIAYSDRLKGDDFLSFLEKRLILIKELMSDNGSIYLHIDYKIGHYVKILMDKVFGQENFRNDITRIKCNPKNFARIGFGNIKDMILFYSKTDDPIWNEPKEQYTEKDLIKLFPKVDKNGRRYTTVPIHAPGETLKGESSRPFKNTLPPKGRHWRVGVDVLEQWDRDGLIEWSTNGNPRKIIYQDEQEGKRIQDIWEFKDPQYPVYPTEKNYEMLNLIVKTSSKEDSIVMDCFCGSGTTLLAAQNNNRHWIGIDSSPIAIEKTKRKIDANNNLFTSDFKFITLNKLEQQVK
jgi:adenine-specific DNA-methyltransferase